MPATVPASPEQRNRYIHAIEELPGLVESAVAGLNDEQLDTSYRDGGWTVRQVIHHLADSHMNAFVRMKLTMTEDYPTIKPYDQDAWAVLPDSKLSVEPSLAILRGLHSRMAALLRSINSEETWRRTAYHPENGDTALDDFARQYAHHGKHHVAQIAELRQRKGW